jgi:hypothetical protein
LIHSQISPLDKADRGLKRVFSDGFGGKTREQEKAKEKKPVQLENTILGANLKYRSNIPKKSSDLIHLLRAQG